MGKYEDWSRYVDPSMPKIEVKFKKLDPRAVIPTYAHDGDVCMDLTAIWVEYDSDHDLYRYHTGLAFEGDVDTAQFLFPRSSNCKTDCYLTNSVGVADIEIYKGEIMLCFKNRTSLKMMTIFKTFEYLTDADNVFGYVKRLFNLPKKYEEIKTDLRYHALEYAPYPINARVAQMMCIKRPKTELTEIDKLGESERGDGGFGASGI